MRLGKSTANKNLRPRVDARLRSRVEGIVLKFQVKFPDIYYDTLWSSRSCNAQAYISNGKKCVRLYGGFVRHRKASTAAIAWVVAHETGHHLGGAPCHPYLPWISSEERADAWAIEVGLPLVFGPRLARRYCELGRREALHLVA